MTPMHAAYCMMVMPTLTAQHESSVAPSSRTVACMQAMVGATRQMLATSWSGSGRRDVYSDFNALTLQISTEALFGENLPADQGARVTGVPYALMNVHHSASSCVHTTGL